MDTIIREICENDYFAVFNLIKDELGYSDINFEDLCIRLNKIEHHSDYFTFVATDGNDVVGFIGLCKGIAYEFDENYVRVVALAVNKNYQNNGVGTKLIEFAEEFAKSIDVYVIGLNSGLKRIDAHMFYEKRGYNKKGYSFSKNLEK